MPDLQLGARMTSVPPTHFTPALPERPAYQHVLLATDLGATTDSFHRQALAVAKAMRARFSLLHLCPTDMAGEEQGCAEILLDGLAARLPGAVQARWVCAPATVGTTLDDAFARHGVDLLLTGGQPIGMPDPTALLLELQAHCRGCDVLRLDDQSCW